MNAAFFEAVRPLFGGSLSQPQVDGFNAIFEAWGKHGDGDNRKLAYILATAKHETANTMQPVRETLAKTDAKAKELLTKAWKSGKLKVSRDYWSSGYFGRGYVQLTHKANYARAEKELGYPFVKEPSLALNDRLAAAILVRGMMEGWFTGKKLSDYPRDFTGARRIVNGTDRAVLIAGYAYSFLEALEKVAAPKPSPTPKPVETIAPVPEKPTRSSPWALIVALGLAVAVAVWSWFTGWWG